jgi:hypothetical protein
MDPTTLFEQTLAAAKAERERVAAGSHLITRDESIAEISPLGITRWYLHPTLMTPSTSALYFCEIEIPESSRTGKLQCQGGQVHLVLIGNGHTVVDGVAHEWERLDGVVIPVKEYGVTFQHFNDGIGPARLLMAWPNLDSAIGAGGGVDMEIVEPAPEWSALNGVGDAHA